MAQLSQDLQEKLDELEKEFEVWPSFPPPLFQQPHVHTSSDRHKRHNILGA